MNMFDLDFVMRYIVWLWWRLDFGDFVGFELIAVDVQFADVNIVDMKQLLRLFAVD